MKQLRLLFALMLLLFVKDGFGQRYYSPIFLEDSLVIINNLVYGHNIDYNTAVTDTLLLDLYQPPASDTVLKPLFIYAHTGSFISPPGNGEPTGDKSDSTCVNFCKQWAESGYVAASVNYRTGWNPKSSDPDVRTGTLLQAVYRGILDLKNAVRFLKSSAINNGNPYHIDTTKIIVFGEGSGGYLSLAYATLDKFSKISNEPKFLNGTTNLPYVDTTILGNLEGVGGSANLSNYPGISDKANFVVNMGGALADTSWLSAGQPPIVAFQCVRDPFAPYDSGIVVVPAFNYNVVAVFGSGVFMPIVNSLHNNDTFALHNFGSDPYTAAARAKYNVTVPYFEAPPNDSIGTGYGEGLMPFILPLATGSNSEFDNQSAPWQFWDSTTVWSKYVNAGSTVDNNVASLASDPDMSRTKGLTYIDTVQRYLLPRIMVAFALPGYQTAGINNVIANNEISIYPNPASSSLNIVVKDNQYQMNSVNVYDLTGRLVRSEEVNNTDKYTMSRNGMDAGIYFLNIHFTNGSQSNAKVVME